jgi:hypothetical protein
VSVVVSSAEVVESEVEEPLVDEEVEPVAVDEAVVVVEEVSLLTCKCVSDLLHQFRYIPAKLTSCVQKEGIVS